MIASASKLGALARALAPPGGDASAFSVLGLPEPDRVELAVEHVTLFGRAGLALVAPYENAHRGTALNDVLGAYAVAGFAPDPAFRDRPDHVSAELALLEGLARREQRARARGDHEAAREAAERSQEFFVRHVRPWVPAFFESLGRAERFPLHGSLAARAAPLVGRGDAPVSRQRVAAEPLCTSCGRPLGFLPPERDDLRPPWGLVCVRCRVRADVGRNQP